MTLMAGDFGADTRLVAFMQYLRVLMVALLATLVSHFFTENSAQAIPVPVLFAPLDLHAFLLTLALIAGCTLLAGVIRLPAPDAVKYVLCLPVAEFFRIPD